MQILIQKKKVTDLETVIIILTKNGCLPTGDNTIKIDVPDGFYDITVHTEKAEREQMFIITVFRL